MTPLPGELARMFEELKVEARASLDQARQDADAAGPGRRLLRVDLLSLREALLDPVLGEAMHQAMFAAFATTQGVAGGPTCDCLVCGERWAKSRLPGLAAMIRVTGPDQLSIALVCKQCRDLPRARLRKRIVAVMKEHFGADEEALLGPGGSA
jgi:hypothetical protein